MQGLSKLDVLESLLVITSMAKGKREGDSLHKQVATDAGEKEGQSKSCCIKNLYT